LFVCFFVPDACAGIEKPADDVGYDDDEQKSSFDSIKTKKCKYLF